VVVAGEVAAAAMAAAVGLVDDRCEENSVLLGNHLARFC